MISKAAKDLLDDMRETVLSGVEYYDDAFVARFEQKMVKVERYLSQSEEGSAAKLLESAVAILKELRKSLSHKGDYSICRDDGREMQPHERRNFAAFFEAADLLLDTIDGQTVDKWVDTKTKGE